MRWLKILCLATGALMLAATLAGGLWAGSRIAFYELQDNVVHLAEKQRYLEDISKRQLPAAPPNIVFILFDDLGYGDLGYTGSRAIATPTIDKLARDGVVLTQFYSPSAICSPARAGYLTGRLAPRAGIPYVVFPEGSFYDSLLKLAGISNRLPAEEITLADVLQAAGYTTGMVGKWHLGDHSPSLPNDMGFQHYFGALYSNDMQPFALYRNRDIEIPAPADQTMLNQWYGAEARRFIAEHSGAPFFLYLAHNFPHIPLFRPVADEGRSRGGLYGDVVEGLDDMVAGIVATLKSQGVYENSLILITSDNGPWFQGSPGPHRGRKADVFEGGMRVPMLAHWPARLPAATTLDGLAMGTDWFPTILDWLQLPLPSDRLIDGNSLRGMLARGEDSPNEYLYFFSSSELAAVRDARYKYHERAPIAYPQSGSVLSFGFSKGPWLFDFATDFNESYDVSALQPGVAERMGAALQRKREEMRDNPRGWVSSASAPER